MRLRHVLKSLIDWRAVEEVINDVMQVDDLNAVLAQEPIEKTTGNKRKRHSAN
jgi:hypothetical protein